MMYQLPSDMMNRIASVVFATMSPCSHSAFRPYGFSTLVVMAVPGVGRLAGGGSTAAGVAGAAAGAAGTAGAVVVWALTSETPAQNTMARAQVAPLKCLSSMATIPLHWILEEGRDFPPCGPITRSTRRASFMARS